MKEQRARLPTATLGSIAPFFIVRDVAPAIAFYCDRLGFRLAYAAPDTPDEPPFFAILERDAVRIIVKAILPEVAPLPNPSRHPWARWDAYVDTAEPDALAAEFVARGASLHVPLADTADGLRGFEIQDPDGYVLFFGRVR
jgi:catechol 2,3-dioxygenase-like lactoylglutathione lyase family enzyme